MWVWMVFAVVREVGEMRFLVRGSMVRRMVSVVVMRMAVMRFVVGRVRMTTRRMRMLRTS